MANYLIILVAEGQDNGNKIVGLRYNTLSR